MLAYLKHFFRQRSFYDWRLVAETERTAFYETGKETHYHAWKQAERNVRDGR